MDFKEYQEQFYKYRDKFRKLALEKGLVRQATSVAKALNQLDEYLAKQGIKPASEICSSLEYLKCTFRTAQKNWVKRPAAGFMDRFAAKLTHINGKSLKNMHPDKTVIGGVEYGDHGPFKFMVGVQPWDDIETVENKLNEASREFRQYWIDRCLDQKSHTIPVDPCDIKFPEISDYLRDASNDRIFPFDDWERIINVYQMKQVPNTTNAAIYRALAAKTNPIPPGCYNANCTDRHRARLVAEDLKAAEFLINTAAANTFPYLPKPRLTF